MKVYFFIFLTLALASYGQESKSQQQDREKTQKNNLKISSAKMKEVNPLLPLLEPALWQKLLKAEKEFLSQPSSTRKVAKTQFLKIAKKISNKHPLWQDKDNINLGGIHFNKKSRTLEIDAEVIYPKHQETGDFLEVLLCTPAGRNHETLFQTKARPLHLEILLHYAGFNKDKEPSLFAVFIAIPGREINLAEMIVDNTGKKLDSLTFCFTGSSFDNGRYAPDQTGDHILFWQVHESVLSCTDDDILTGSKKILAKRHKDLPDGTKVKLLIKPIAQDRQAL